jgi:molecular chaperone HtpG
MLSYLTEFDGKPLMSVTKGGLDLGKLTDEAEKEEQQQASDEYKDILARIKEALADRVKEVRVTVRLTDSPACIVAEEGGMSAHLARLMKMAGQEAPDFKPVFEINPKHPLIQRLKYEDSKFADWVNLLFDQALLAEGGQLDDPASFVRRLNELLLSMASK